MACIVMAYVGMACVDMAYPVMVYPVMAFVGMGLGRHQPRSLVMACIVMAFFTVMAYAGYKFPFVCHRSTAAACFVAKTV